MAAAEDEVLQGIEYGRLGPALDRLAPELRAVVQACVLDGLSTREASTLWVAVALVLIGAAAVARLDAGGPLLFLTLAPLVPLAGVARAGPTTSSSFGPRP